NVHIVEATALESSAPAMPPILPFRGETVPVVSLHRVLGVEPPADSRRAPVLVLEFAGRRLAATCDKIIGPREIVVKSLAPLLAPPGLSAGATISGSGKVQLILDPAALVAHAYPASPPAAETGAIAATSSPPVEAGASETRPRVLVADDSRLVRES